MEKSADPNQILIDALEWYADKYNYSPLWEGGEISDADLDKGKMARQALKEYYRCLDSL